MDVRKTTSGLLVLAGAAALGLILMTAAVAQEMSAEEHKAMQHAIDWQKGSGLVTEGREGKVIFLHGQGQPSVICAPLQVCDIELEAQETVRDVLLGDSVRWSVEAASSGDGAAQTIHLIVRPTEAGLSTSMIVTTSKRTYHIRLRSHESRYMARVGFTFPNALSSDLARINQRFDGANPATANDRLDFAYRLSGQASFRPRRVYSDGRQTFIQFPPFITASGMPVLYLTTNGDRQIVNYRVRRDLMIVDIPIDRAVLVAGTGWRQKKITITRGK